MYVCLYIDTKYTNPFPHTNHTLLNTHKRTFTLKQTCTYNRAFIYMYKVTFGLCIYNLLTEFVEYVLIVFSTERENCVLAVSKFTTIQINVIAIYKSTNFYELLFKLDFILFS